MHIDLSNLVLKCYPLPYMFCQNKYQLRLSIQWISQIINYLFFFIVDIPISIRHLLDNEFVISWTNLFTSVSTIVSYDVSIGSLEGNTDILMPTSTPRDNILIYIPENVKKVYCGVIATSQSGLSEIYRQNMILG